MPHNEILLNNMHDVVVEEEHHQTDEAVGPDTRALGISEEGIQHMNPTAMWVSEFMEAFRILDQQLDQH